MRRQEARLGKVGEYEFQFWECWEPDPQNPQAPERHWFRAPNGMEASSADEMLQKLTGRFVAPHQPAASIEEWERTVGYPVRVGDEDVVIEVHERYTSENPGVPKSVTVRGPNGLVTSSYAEMLELLGVAPEKKSLVASSQSSVRAERFGAEPSATTTPSAGTSVAVDNLVVASSAFYETETVGEELAVSQDGKLITSYSNNGPVGEAEPAVHSQSHPPLRGLDAGKSAAATDDDREDPNCDAVSERETDLRSDEFERQHPWLWGDQNDEQEEYGAEWKHIVEEMKLIWHVEETKAVYPELYAAALDPTKYREYREKNEYEAALLRSEGSAKEAAPVAAESPRCQFVKSDGEPCGSPALKRRRLCHFHSKTDDGRKRRKRKNAENSVQPERSTLELPVLEDDLAIQMAVTNICRQLANESIEPKRAATLLYGLQVASAAVRRTAQNRR